MLDGWYCRTMSNQQNTSASAGSAAEHSQNANFSDSDEDEQQQQNQRQRKLNNLTVSTQQQQHHLQQQKVDYKTQYLNLKKKLKYLIYENEFFQDTLRSSQRRLLKVSRDRSFLLDRLLQYEKNEISSSESDETESSDDDGKTENVKRKKLENSNNNQSNNNNAQNNNVQTQNKVQNSGTTSAGSKPPRKRAAGKKSLLQMNENTTSSTTTTSSPIVTTIDGHMTPDEVARHLQSRHSLMELVPERAPPTVPNEMFSNEPSLDSESNDQMIVTSPNNLGEECISVDLNIMQD